MRNFIAVALSCALSPVALAQAPEAAGQSAEAEQSGEVIVTARKREERIQDVPAAITSLSADAIRELGGIDDIGDLSNLAPGVQFTNTGNLNAELNIRGSGAGTVRTANTDSPIAILRDGASITVGNIGGRGYARSDLFDVQRVEVIRGPQGVLYGQNSTGGVINAITRRPDMAFGGSAASAYNFTVEEVTLEGVVNAPVIQDRLAVRLGLQHENRADGHFTNRLTGKAGDINRYTGGRVAILGRPSDTVEAFLVFDASDEQGPSNRVKSETLGVNDPDGPYTFGHNTRDRSDRELLSSTLNLEWNSPIGAITSVSAWRSRETTFLQDEDGTAPGYARTATGGAGCSLTRACETLFADDSELWSQEIRWEALTLDRWSLLVGVNYEARLNDFFTVSRGRTTSATNATPSPTANNSAVSTSIDNFYGAFATLDVEATDRLDLSFGARYTEIQKKFNSYQVTRGSTVAGCPAFDVVIDVSFPPACRTGARFIGSSNEDNFSPAFSAMYELTPTLRTFFTFARGFRAGGFNNNVALINASPAPGEARAEPSFSSETSDAFEIGLKGEALSARFSASYYFNRINDLIVTLPSTDTTGQTRNFRTNAGEAETMGVDVEVNGELPGLVGDQGRLSYGAALNWFDGEYKSGPFAGFKVEGQPEWQGTFSLIYRRPLTAGIELFSSASYRLQRDGLTATAGNRNAVPLDDVDNIDARIGLEFANVELLLEATNLLDNQDIILRDSVTAAFPQGQRLVYQDPREVALRVRYVFGQEAAGGRE